MAPLQGQVLERTQLRVPRHATVSLDGLTLLENATHGKHLLTRLTEGVTLHPHLRMQGSWTVTRPGRRLPGRVMPDVRVVQGTGGASTDYGIRLPVVDLCFVGVSPWMPVGEVDVARLLVLGARALRISATVEGSHQITTGRSHKGERHYVAGRLRQPCLRCGTHIEVRPR